MGLLTDPRAGNGRFVKFILEWERSLCFFMYLGGVLWMMLLALPAFNDNTYFSENALLPGLVTKESNLEHASKQFHRELVHEMERYPDGMPYAWLSAKFNQLHLDVFSHNFTLNYPFVKQKFTGQNIYGIVRAPRAPSTEAIVVSVPYRSTMSIHPETTSSIALLLAFAKFCRKQKYWAKDIIFLVTEHEQLGMQAWLEAYHGVTSGQENVLLSGDLPGRAGSIQAAVNLEIHATKVTSIDVKIEGLNGQLPNLDLFNLAQIMIAKEGIHRSFQRRFDTNIKDQFKKWCYQFTTLMMMVGTQATGVPTGNHGLFHRFGIEAITLEGFKKSGQGPEVDFYHVGRVVESIVRSLNNLLERFHQSYFFYLLPSTDRYISIGLYMRPLVLIIGGIFIKAFSTWLRLQSSNVNKDQEKSKSKSSESPKKNDDIDIGTIAKELLWTHILGVALMFSPQYLTKYGSQLLDLRTEDSVYFGFVVATIFTVLLPFFNRSFRPAKYQNKSLINVITCIEFGTTLMCVAMHNFSLALLAATVYVPAVLLVTPKQGNRRSRLGRLVYILWVLLHPFVVTSLAVLGYTMHSFPEESITKQLLRSFKATKQALVYGVIDSMIYGNWFYNITTAVVLPLWLLCWNIVCCDTRIQLKDKLD